jgi:hypothetical protein
LWRGGKRRQQALEIRFGEEKRFSQPAASPKRHSGFAQGALGDRNAARSKAINDHFGRLQLIDDGQGQPPSELKIKAGRRDAGLCRPAGGSRAWSAVGGRRRDLGITDRDQLAQVTLDKAHVGMGGEGRVEQILAVFEFLDHPERVVGAASRARISARIGFAALLERSICALACRCRRKLGHRLVRIDRRRCRGSHPSASGSAITGRGGKGAARRALQSSPGSKPGKPAIGCIFPCRS